MEKVELTEKVEVVRYMNMRTDYAFKFLFSNKELLMDFLNEIIGQEEKITDIEYLPTEQLGVRSEDRKAIFDLYCTRARGDRIIIEMQVARQKHFMDRCLFYSTFPIRSQAKKGKWDYKLVPLYYVAILDFELFGDAHYLSHCSLLREETLEKVTDNLNFIIVELPKFKKPLLQVQTNIDSWLFCMKHLETLSERPDTITGSIFERLFDLAETDKLKPKEMEQYRNSVTDYWDVQLAMDYSMEVGMEKGMKKGEERGLRRGVEVGMERGMKRGISRGKEEERMIIAQKILREGFPIEAVSKITGMTIEQIQSFLSDSQ